MIIMIPRVTKTSRPCSTRLLGVLLFAAAACGRDVTAPPSLVEAKPSTATSLALGARFGCVSTTELGAFCWGDNSSGQMGDSTRSRRVTPVPTRGSHVFVAIAAAEKTACGLDKDGAAWCWGEDATKPGVAGAIADVPTKITPPLPILTIAVGRRFACGLAADGEAFCWGENGRGQLGVGDTLRRTGITVVPDRRFVALSLGFWHACGLESGGAVYCWGDNQYGEIGLGQLGAALFIPTPQRVSGTVSFKLLASGSIHTCGLSTSGQAYCWGSNFGGYLGNGTADFKLSPTPVSGGLTFTTLRASRANSIFSHTCGIATSGDVYCWGWNSSGQLGSAITKDACVNQTTGAVTEQCSYLPVKVAGVSGAIALDVGVAHSCAVIGGFDTRILCWGDNTNGQLGDGTLTSSTLPVQVLGGLKLPSSNP